MLTSKRHINLQKLQHKKAKLTAGRRSTSRMGIDSGEARADTSTNTNTHTHAWASQPSATFCGRCCRTTPWPDGLCGVQCCASCRHMFAFYVVAKCCCCCLFAFRFNFICKYVCIFSAAYTHKYKCECALRPVNVCRSHTHTYAYNTVALINLLVATVVIRAMPLLHSPVCFFAWHIFFLFHFVLFIRYALSAL